MAPRFLLETISAPFFYKPFIASFIFYIAIFIISTLTARKTFHRERARAWLLTLISALVMTGGGLGFAFAFFASKERIDAFPLLDVDWANAVCACFIAFLAADSVLGWLYFRGEVHWLTGWIHHVGYAIVVLVCIQHRVAGGFLTFASLLELPTIPLALGHINKSWRRDYLFGLLFFTTRVVLNAGWVNQQLKILKRPASNGRSTDIDGKLAL
ncbi:hypothetical protein SeMB42_g01732 [Synchytrium endobioticum]|uniref:TLC domain-containing protein n=1 Tax=Synchytrium endobioticum TaxID=286115 RepID=A0A507DM43_9FUNG|nr:hypothetical protein SeLEV6574_g01672 [Synchytrium endobioticum]TPX51960.1 hypothetical protein SeMB42_g01732 [Synchytrium endobioticum]